MTTHFVDPDLTMALNLRKGPKPAERVAVLPAGTNITKIAEHADDPIWWQVNARLPNRDVMGWLHSGYLAVGTFGFSPSAHSSGSIPESHLSGLKGRRSLDGQRARRLGEADQVTCALNGANRKDCLVRLAQYLEPDKSSHLRYKPSGGTTYCNIYAHDFCNLAGVFLPRVWWKPEALTKIEAGENVKAAYGTTVNEIRANELHDWFEEYGEAFGWSAATDATELQDAANQGKTAVIVAKRWNTGKSGHITMVIPEHAGFSAARDGNGAVLRPVESQAGSANYTAVVKSNRWWLGQQFQSHGFWINS